jgi:RNA polymerase sigma-70 factor (ECF subfamily)
MARSEPYRAEVETDVAEEPRRFEDFFGSEHARLFGAISMVTGDRHEAEEIMQDAFLRLWERWDRVRELDDPSSYCSERP